MVTHISGSPGETEQLGENSAALAAPGKVFALSGDLGAGKTQWVKGFARGLGIAERVQSPTFALINEYDGARVPLYHLDLYRLNSPQAVVAAGLAEYLPSRSGVSVVEWAEHYFARSAFEGLVWVTIDTIGETARRITYEGPGY